MRFSVITSLSCLAVVASAFPVRDSKPQYTPTTVAPSTPTSVICCVAPGVPTRCSECHSHDIAPAVDRRLPTGILDTDFAYPPEPTLHDSPVDAPVPAHHYNDTTSTPMVSAESHNVALSTRIDKSAYLLAQRHPDQFLSQYVFQNLRIDEFKFGKGTSGNLGSNMISQYITVPVGKTQLAIHINAVVTASGLQNNAMTITVQHFHITARSVASQITIDKHGPSALTAAKSIHLGFDQPQWAPPAYVQNLAREIGVDPLPTLRRDGYTAAYVRYLETLFKAGVKQSIDRTLGGNVVVNWRGDASFPA